MNTICRGAMSEEMCAFRARGLPRSAANRIHAAGLDGSWALS